MKCRARRTLLVATLCAVLSGCGGGQGAACEPEATGGLAVTVVDPSGQSICDGTVSAVSSDYGGPIRFTLEKLSDGSCSYVSLDGSSGTHYDVTVTAPGHQSSTVDGVSAPPVDGCPQSPHVTVVLSPLPP